jgi:hypothetical protein
MKKITFLLMALVTVSAGAQTYVSPYLKKDGTYVEGHYKSQPNSTKTDNYSSQGNSNPYTGKQGTVDPYKQPTPTYGQQCGTTSDGRYVCR